MVPPGAETNMDDITSRIDKIAIIDKIDMSLDDIIRLNKQLENDVLFNGNASKSNWMTPYQKGAGGMRREEMRPYYTRTGQSGHKMSSRIGADPYKRPLRVMNASDQHQNFRRPNFARARDFVNRLVPSRLRHYYNGYSNYSETRSFRRGQKLRQQRNNRQATYVHKRGLEVQATMDIFEPEEFIRPKPWRTCMTHSGILTVSVANPTAIAFPSVGTRLPRSPLPFLLKKEGAEVKVPKGVPLDFDINSVAKQTGITLNERFKILKEQRLSQTIGKGSRFVTVG
ncbi:UAP56-interacting factor isoform X2 [Pseudophryne corroboree]|uniref:UAP56-interacting factor isoform X2 n=1 Tax=Pseudophryne corroboree TaxID=495146 RepID=UPI0030819549